jgi:hypothetical protein
MITYPGREKEKKEMWKSTPVTNTNFDAFSTGLVSEQVDKIGFHAAEVGYLRYCAKP